LKKVMLNLGCGMDYRQEFVNCDVNRDARIDVLLDIGRLPFKDDCIDEILISHVIEYYDVPDLKLILNEMLRVIKHKSPIRIFVPHGFSVGAYNDIEHKKCFESNTLFVFLNKQKYVNYDFYIATYLQFSNKILSFLINKFDIYKRDKIAKILPFSCEIAYIVIPNKLNGSGAVKYLKNVGNVFKSHGDRGDIT